MIKSDVPMTWRFATLVSRKATGARMPVRNEDGHYDISGTGKDRAAN